MLAAIQILPPRKLEEKSPALKLAQNIQRVAPTRMKVDEVKFIPLDELKLLRGVKDGLLGARSYCPKSRAHSYRESARTLFRWAKRWKNNDMAPPSHCHQLMEAALADVHLDNETGFLAGSLLRMGTYYGMFSGGSARSFHARLEVLASQELAPRSQERVQDLMEDAARYF